MHGEKETELRNFENQIDLENVTVKIEPEDEEDEEIIAKNLPQFSYTLDLSFQHKHRDEIPCETNKRINPSLKYVKLKSDNSIETNSDTPWALAKKVFPRSLERILANCGVDSYKKIRNDKLSDFNSNKKTCTEKLNTPSEKTTYSHFQKCDRIWNSTVNSASNNIGRRKLNCNENELSVADETDTQFQPLYKKTQFSNKTSIKEPPKLNVDKENVTQNMENMNMSDAKDSNLHSSEHINKKKNIVSPKKAFSSLNETDTNHEYNIEIRIEDGKHKSKKKTKHKKLDSSSTNDLSESMYLGEDQITVGNIQNSCNVVNLDPEKIKRRKKRKISVEEVNEKANEIVSINTEFAKIEKVVYLPEEYFHTKQKGKTTKKECGNSIEENKTKLQKRSEFNHFTEDQNSLHIGYNESSIDNEPLLISLETEQIFKKKKKKTRCKDFAENIEKNDVTKKSGKKVRCEADTDNNKNELTFTEDGIDVIQNDCNELPLSNVKIKKKKKWNIVAEEIDNQVKHNSPDNIEFYNITEDVELLEKHIKKRKIGKKTKLEKLGEHIEENENITKQNKKKRKRKDMVESISDMDPGDILMAENPIAFDDPQIGCDDLNDKHEKIRPNEQQGIDNLELSGEYIKKKKKKKRFKEFGTNIENSISIDESNIENENSTNVDYKKKKKSTIQSHSKVEEKVIENDGTDNTIFDNTVNRDDDLCVRDHFQFHGENSELEYTNDKYSKKKHSKHASTEFFNFANSLSEEGIRKKRKKRSSVLSNGNVKNNEYKDGSIDCTSTEIETEHIVDVVSIKKHKKKKRNRVTSNISSYENEFEKHVFYEDNTNKQSENVITKLGEKQFQQCMEDEGEIISNEKRNSTKIKQKKKIILIDEKDVNSASEENQDYPGNNQDVMERRKLKKNKNKKKDVDQSSLVHDSEQIRSENYADQPDITDDLDLNSNNNKTTEVEVNINKRNKKKAFDLDKRISDLLTAKVELLLKSSGLDQRRNDKNEHKKSSNIKIVDSTVNININTDIKQNRSQNKLSSNKLEGHKKKNREAVKSNENITALDTKISEEYSSSNEDFIVLKFGNGKMLNNETTLDMPYNSEKENRKKKLKQVSSTINMNKITNLQKEENVHIVDSSDFENEIEENNVVPSILCPDQEKSDIILTDRKNESIIERKEKRKEGISNELTSGCNECSKTSKAEYLNQWGLIKTEEEFYQRKLNYQHEDYADNVEEHISEKKKSNEIFIKNNSVPITEIDLFDSDAQSEIDESENIQNLNNSFTQQIKKVEYSENNAKEKTKKQHLSDPLIEPCEIFQTEDFKNQSDQEEKCERKKVSNIVDSAEKKTNRRKANKETAKHKNAKRNLEIERTEIIENDQDIFTGIFNKKELGEEKDKKSDMQQNIPSGEEINNVKPISFSKCVPSEEKKDSLNTKDSSNQLLENSNNEKSFSFADILSQSHSDRLMQKCNDILTASNLKNNSPKVSVSERASRQEASSSNRAASLKSVGKSQSKQRTLDNFVEIVDSEDRKKKHKVIQLLKESKSIQEIEEELEFPNVDEEREAVQHLVIETPFPISPIHKIAYLISDTPNARQKQQLKDAGITFKLGKYTKEEDKRITQNWLEFCKFHDWDPENYSPFLKTSAKSETGVLQRYQRLKFAQYISKGFDNRFMYSVYRRFQRLFSKKERENGRFTEEDDKIIEEYVRSKKSIKPFADLANILKRTRLGILKRYQLIQSKKSSTCERLNLTKEMTECLLVNLIDVTCSVNLSELKHRFITIQEWQKISTNMGIPIDKLRSAWRFSLHPRFFTTNYLQNLRSTKTKLVDLLYVKYNDWRAVDWSETARELDGGFTSVKLCKIMRDMLLNVPPKKRNDVQGSLKYLRKHYRAEDRTVFDKYKFVEEILKETKNGTVMPKISKVFKKNPAMERTEQRIESSDELDELLSD